MTYLPELRESLVKAAERQSEAPSRAPAPVQSHRAPRGFGSLVLIGASLAALVVAGAVLVLVGHRAPKLAPASSQYRTRGAALSAAEELLAAFRPPAGAVAVEKDPSRPRSLGWVYGGLPVPSAIDLSRFYVVRGDAQSVIAKIDAQRSLGPGFAPVDPGPFGQMYSTSSSSGGGSSDGSSSASMTLALRGLGSLARQLVIQTVSAGHGVVAMRVDAQTWWTALRPASEQIPSNARAIVIQRLGPIPKAAARLHAPGQLVEPSEVRSTIAFLNSVGVAQPSTGISRCGSAKHFRLRLIFTGTDQHPAPLVIIDPNCGTVVVSLRGQAEPTLALGSPTNTISPLRGLQLLELLTGAPQTKTWGQLIAQAKRDQPTGASSRTTSSAAAQATPAR